jgi:transcriptional/translational regulatory protein YebC/TACO1
VPITHVATAQALVGLQEALEEIDDVQYVFTNEEMDESISAAVHGG